MVRADARPAATDDERVRFVLPALQSLVLTVRFTVGVNIDDASNLSRVSAKECSYG
jgi:hypothetical protein